MTTSKTKENYSPCPSSEVGEAPRLRARRIGIVSRDYWQEFGGKMDFSSVLVDVLHLLDENKCDTVWEAFIDFKHRSVFLSRIESEIIQAMIRGMPDRACAAARASGLLEVASDGKLMPNRERRELEQKLLKFQLDVPWA